MRHRIGAMWGNCMLNDILTIKDVAEYLKLNEKTTYRLVASGKIPAFKVGGTWRFLQSDINNWIEEQSAQRKLG